jgi:hypothetical protein
VCETSIHLTVFNPDIDVLLNAVGWILRSEQGGTTICKSWRYPSSSVSAIAPIIIERRFGPVQTASVHQLSCKEKLER